MSKIGQAAIAAQEEVLNPLGYSTVEEAIADGWDSAEWLAAYAEEEQNQAHEAWLKEKEELLSELYQLKDMLGLRLIEGGMPYLATVNRAITFIGRISHE